MITSIAADRENADCWITNVEHRDDGMHVDVRSSDSNQEWRNKPSIMAQRSDVMGLAWEVRQQPGESRKDAIERTMREATTPEVEAPTW